MSGYDCRNRWVFSLWRNVVSDGADWTSTGRLFQSRGPAVVQLYAIVFAQPCRSWFYVILFVHALVVSMLIYFCILYDFIINIYYAFSSILYSMWFFLLIYLTKFNRKLSTLHTYASLRLEVRVRPSTWLYKYFHIKSTGKTHAMTLGYSSSATLGW